jgi:type I restriction enzyme S subunit
LGLSFEWKEVRLSDIAEFANGKKRPSESGKIPVYGGNGIMDYTNSYNSEGETVIIGRVGAYCGNVHYENQPCWISDNAIAAKPCIKGTGRYLYYKLKSMNLYNMRIGSSQPLLTQSLIKDIVMKIPSTSEQIKISDILTALDYKIELNNAINKNLEEMAQALFKRWFVDFEFPNENGEPYKSSGGEFEESELGLIPKGWKVGRATDIFDVQSGGTPKTSTSEYWNGEIPFFTPKDCSNSLYVIETEKTITEDGLNNCNSKLYKTDTVFITARGTVGKVALAGRDMAMNQSCYALVAKSGYTQKYVFHLTQQLVNVLRKNASGAVFDAITVSTFQNLKTTLPDIELVRHFDGLVNGLYSLLLEKANETQTLQQLRDTLLPKLMSGEIRVPVERDNSATELPMVAESSAIYKP